MSKPNVWEEQLISDKSELNNMLKQFLRIPYQPTYYRLFGKVVQSPRLMRWYADNPDWTYAFSRNHIEGLRAHPFSPLLNKLRRLVEEATGQKFNAALVNLYRNGNDKIDPHSDDDPWLGSEFMVPSFSLGATRLMTFTKKDDKNVYLTVPLISGQLLVMGPTVQTYWNHSIARQPNITQPRINVTFRYIHPDLVNKQPNPIPIDKLSPQLRTAYLNLKNEENKSELPYRLIVWDLNNAQAKATVASTFNLPDYAFRAPLFLAGTKVMVSNLGIGSRLPLVNELIQDLDALVEAFLSSPDQIKGLNTDALELTVFKTA